MRMVAYKFCMSLFSIFCGIGTMGVPGAGAFLIECHHIRLIQWHRKGVASIQG